MRTPIEVNDVVVNELPGRCIPSENARAESRGQPGHEGSGGRDPPARDGSRS